MDKGKLTRRGLMAALGLAAVGGAGWSLEKVTTQDMDSARTDAEFVRLRNIKAGLKDKTGNDWDVDIDHGHAKLVTADGDRIHTQTLYHSYNNLAAYQLETVSARQPVEAKLEYDGKARKYILPKDAPFTPEDRKIIEALMNARENMLDGAGRRALDYILPSIKNKIGDDLGVDMTAKFSFGNEPRGRHGDRYSELKENEFRDYIKFTTKPEDDSVPVEYICVYSRGSSQTPEKWIVKSGLLYDHGYILPNGQIRHNEYGQERGYDKNVLATYKIPAITGEPSGDLRKHAQNLAPVIYAHGKLKIEPTPGVVTRILEL